VKHKTSYANYRALVLQYIIYGGGRMRGIGNKVFNNKIFSESEKTLIFVHKANSFVIDKSVMKEAAYIKLAKEEWKESGEDVLYYYLGMKAAAKSNKKYLIMEYEYIIAFMIEELLKAPGQWNFTKWNFRIFFHADTCPEGKEPDPMYNANDEKLDLLWELNSFPFIIKCSIPVGHNLTIADLQRMEKDASGPETVEEFKELFENMKNGIKKELLFPYYETDYEKLKEYIARHKEQQKKAKTRKKS